MSAAPDGPVPPGADPAPDPDAAALYDLCHSAGHDPESCVRAFSGVLFTLARRYGFPEPEDAVYRALRDICADRDAWPASRLSARAWVVAVARRSFERQLQLRSRPDIAPA